MISKIFTKIVLLSLASGTFAQSSGPYLYHSGTKPKDQENLMALVTSKLIPFSFQECSLTLWRNSGPDNSPNEYDNLVIQFSRHFSSAVLLQNNSLTESSLPLFNSKLHVPCSVVLYFDLNYFHGSNLFPHNWFSHLPGDFFSSYHIIFHNVSPTIRGSKSTEEFTLKKLPDPLQRMIHRVFISVTKSAFGYKCVLWECNIFGESCNQVEISRGKGALTTDTLNLKGLPLVWGVVTVNQISQKKLEHYIKFRQNINVFITPFVEISEALNGTPTLRQVTTQTFGTLQEDGTWDGATGEVFYWRAYVSVGLVTKDSYAAFFLSKAIDNDGLTFATGIPTVSAGSPFFLIESYDWTVWTALLITIIVLIVVSLMIRKKYFSDNVDFRNGLNFWNIIGPLLDQPADSKGCQKFLKVAESRWMFGPWLLSLVVLGTIFKTSLISTLTSPTVNNPPTNFQNLVALDYKLKFLGIKLTAGAVFKDLKARGILLIKELDKRVVSYYDDMHQGENCVSEIWMSSYACIGMRTQLLDVAVRYLTEESGQPLYRIVHEYLYSSNYAFIISKKLPHLLAFMDKMMYHYAESGSYDMFRSIEIRNAQKYGILAAKGRKKRNSSYENTGKLQKNSNKNRDKDMENILRSLLVLCMGFGLATMVFGVELLYHYFSALKVVRK